MYTVEATAIRASLRSERVLVQNYTITCPPVTTKTDCAAIWVAWGGCEAGGLQVMRYTVEVEAVGGGRRACMRMASRRRSGASTTCTRLK